MNSGNYENKILDAIQRIVDNAVSHASYDKTIKGTIVKVADEDTGKYLIKYQDSSFYAYSNDSKISYSVDDMVYVLIPGNDMTQMKTIIGAVDKIGINYIDTLESQDAYDIIGNNIVNDHGNRWGLCSYKPSGDAIVLYDKDNLPASFLDIDTVAANTYLKQAKYLMFGGNFQTMLDPEQKFQGNFGLALELSFLDNNTGETVDRVYKIDINEMTGNPYEYLNTTEQFVAFQIDGENFQSINKITFFSYDFPIEDEEKTLLDIFTSNIFLKGADKLSDDELRGNSIKLITPQGIYFDNNDAATASRSITAEVRIDGTLLSNNSNRAKYYWFRQNSKISKDSEAFQRYGGIGWECLNEYTTITEEGVQLREWTPASAKFSVTKGNSLAKENVYKCVAVYNDNTILSKEITFYNYSSAFDITVVSDSGEYFSYDVGNPTLTCYVNGSVPTDTQSVTWTYAWMVKDNNNIDSLLTETTSDNTAYNNAVAAYDELKTGLENGTILLTQESQEQLVSLANTISGYDSIMRVEANNIYKVKLNTITNFSTYTCFVYRNNVFVGKASITITNDLAKNRNAYTLVINNGNQVFKYNENGIAPTSKSLDKVQELYPLSFTLFDDAGKEIDNNAIKAKDVEWTVPTTNTLITVSSTHGNPSSVDTINETATYKNYKELYFTIANIYNANKDRNTIQLKVKYKDRVVVTKTDLLFMKEGEVGTNGTDFVCRIVPNAIDDIVPKYPTVIYNKNAAISATNPRLNFTPASESLWFKAELWHDGIKIFDGVTTGQSGESKQVKVEWEILKNKYASNVIDVSNFIVNKTTGVFEFNNLSAISDATLKANPANIVKCTLTYDDIEYYATMPITLVTTTAAKYRAELEELSGFRYVMYTTDGAKPIYDSANPFALRIYQTDNNIEQDISQTVLSDYSVDYTWSVKGLSYGASSWNTEANLIEKTLYSDTLEKNQKRFIPIDTCNGYAVNNALYCSITRDGTELMSIHIPIHLYLNKYGNAALNGWDGNHIEINEDGGFILAPQIGAGKKNQDNSFTGVFMGSVKEAGKTKEEYGLYGYNAGERTIALNAEDGSARFGKAGMGQIVLDPTDNTATLRSGDYIAPILDEHGNVTTPGQGLEIDLTDPHITFGSGNFRVDSDGQVYATGFATIAALNAGDIDIPGTNNFKLEYATDTVQIETDANLDPIETTVTKTITCKCLYKNSYTSDYTVNLIDENGNIITHNANSDGIGVSVSKSGNVATITFTALKNRQISHAVNSYLFRFTYTQKANTKIDKTFNANLVIQGKDGERGATGPVGPAGRDGTSVTVKGSYSSLSDLTTAASTGIITPVAGDGYIIGNDLYVFTNGAGGGGSQAGDWTDIGQFKGDDAKNCVIAASAQVFKSTDGTNYAPNNITLTPYLWAVTFDKWQYVINNGTPQDLNGTLPTGISINSTTKVLTITKDCALFNSSSAITFKCLTDDNNVYDTVTIIKVTDGIDGEDGSDGESAYNAILTNEAQTIAGDNTKALATTITTGVIGYLGSTKKNTSIGTITIKDASGQTIPSSAISASVSNNNTQNTTITFTVTNQLTAKNGQATIPVTIDSTTINKIFTFSLALKGSDGKGITAVTNYYATSNNGSTAPTGSAWKTDISQLTPLSASNKYLWNYESVSYTSGDPVETDPAVIGVYGDTGLSSTDGMPNIPPIRRWTFDKVAVKVINNEAKNCYLENNNDAYNFIQQGSSQIVNQYSMAVFDGTQAVRTDSSNINFNNNVSISFWLNPGNVNTTQTILQNRVETSKGLSVFLVNKQLRLDIGGTSNTFDYYFNTNTNYHVVVTYNKTNGQKKLYVNGKLKQTITITHVDQTFTNYLWIGKSSTNGTSFNGNVFIGTLDDLRIYDYLLDLDNVDFLYRSNGQEAANGDNGRGLSSVVEYYLAYNSNEGVTKSTSGWTTSIQTVTSSNKYLWNYERINYTDGSWSETNPVIIGTYGDKGDKGDTGDSAVNILLTNEAQVIAGDTSKAIATEITTDVLGFIGSTQVATTVTAADISGLPTGMTATVSNHDNISTITFNVTTSMTSKSGQVTIPVKITINNVEMTINKIFSYSLSLKGATGGAGTAASMVDISATSQVFKSLDGGTTYSPNEITLTPRFQTVSYQDDSSHGWFYSVNGGSSWTKVSSGTNGLTISGNNLKISKTSALFSSSVTSIVFKCISSNTSVFDTMTIVRLSDGTNGVGVSGYDVEYQASNNGTTVPTGTWQSSVPSVNNGQYLWTRTRIYYTNSTTSDSYSVSYKGTNGTNGTSVTITTKSIQYAEGSDGTTVPTTGWQNSIPAIEDGKYLWTKTYVKYSDNNETTSYSVSYQSSDGLSLWTTTAAPTSNVYTRDQLVGPNEDQTPRVGEIIIRSNRYQYTITAVSGNNITVGTAVDLKGATGTSATNIVCGNEAQVIFCDKDGKTSGASTINIPFAGYLGNSRKACSVTYSTLPSGITLSSNTAATTSADGALVLSVASGSTLGGNNSGIITLTFSCNSLTFTKNFSWSKAKTGASGNDAYTVVLSNESHTFPATNSAAIASSVDVDVIAYKGATSVTPTIGEITGQVTGLTTSVSGTTITISATTSLTTQSGTLSIPVTVDGKSFTKKFSWSLAKAGANGTSPTAYSLIVSHAAVTKTASGTYSPASITLTAKSQTGNAAISNFTTGRYAIFLNGSSTATTIVASTANYSYTIPADTTSIRIALYNSSTGTTILDEQTVPVVSDGVNGTSPFISYLTNETQSFVYAKAVSIETSLYGYQGTTEKTVQIKTINGVAAATTDTATGKTGMNFKVSSTSAVTHPKITFTTTTSLPQGASEKLAIVYRVTGESSDRTIYFTYSTTTRGAAGTDASLVDISASSQIFKSADGGINFAPNSITLTPRFQTVTYSKWQYTTNGGSSWTDVTSGSHGLTISGNNLTISKDSDLYTESLTAIPFKCVSSNSSIYDVMTIAKLYDVGNFEIGGKNLLLKAQAKIYGSGTSGESLDNSNYLYDGSLIYTRPAVSNQGFYVTQYNLMEPDTDYLVSFKAKVTSGTVNQFYMFGTSPNNIASSYLIVDGVKKSTNAKDTSITVDLTDGKYHNFIWGFRTSATITTGNYTGNILQWNKTNTTAFTIELKGLKWERGSKPTDWSPAPEDINANITAAQTTANSAQTLATQVQTDLANLSIGGRNLVLGTNTSVTATGTGGTNQCKNLYKFSQYYLNNYYPKTATAGESLQVTISYDWTATATSGTFRNQVNGSPYSGSGIPTITLSESNTSGHFSHVWTLSKGTNATSYTHIAVRFDNLTGDVTFSNLKIEVGNKETDWSAAPEDTTTYVDNLVADLQTQVDGKIQTYSQTADPSSSWTTTIEKQKHTGDLWYNPNTKTTKRWSGTEWVNIDNAEAEAASVLAATKAQVFTGTPTVPYYKGDLWITALDKTGVVKTCKTSRTTGSYSSSDWVEGLKYTDDTLATQIQNDLNNLTIGGRNYLSGYVSDVGSKAITVKNWSNCIYEEDSTAPSGYRMAFTLNDDTNNAYVYLGSMKERLSALGVKDGDPITVSFYCKTDSQTLNQNNTCKLECLTNAKQLENPIPNTNWQRQAWTGIYSNSTQYNALYIINWQIWSSMAVGEHIYISSIQIEKGNRPTDWNAAPEDTTSYIDNLVADLQDQVDGKIQTYSQTTDPSTNWSAEEKIKHTGDLWYSSSTKITKRWSGSTWTNIENAEAEAAATLASSKAQIFTSTPTIPYYKGDLWITALNKTGVVKTCQTTRTTGSYTASDWVEGLKYTDDTLATQVQTNLNNLEVGGRNLLIGSSAYLSNSPWTVTTTNKDGWVWNDNIYTNFQVKTDEEYVIQAKTDGTWSPTHITTGQSSDLVTLWLGGNDTPKGHSTNLKQVSFLTSSSNYLGNGRWKWKVPSSFNNKYLVVRVNNYNEDGTTSVTHNYWDFKLEKGNKATDWTPAPEDVDNAIGQAVKSITELYYLHTSSSSAPTAPTEHVTSTSTSAGVWTTKCPTWSSGKYYWTCSEILYASGEYAWTTPLVVNGLNSANATANTANTTANTASDKINNLKVGGTNIIRNSNASFINTNGVLYLWTKENTANISQYTADSTYNPCFKINVTTADNRAYQSVSNVWQSGKIYTISGFVKASATGKIRFSRSGSDYSADINATTSWTYFSTTITSTATASTGTISIHCRTANVDFYLANLKFEEGNTPTAWSPSPLDEMSSVDVEYYLSTSNSTVTGGNWSSTAPAWSSGKYLWTRNKITWKNTAITYTNAVLEKVINDANISASTANDKIDNLKVGGTNYYKNSKDIPYSSAYSLDKWTYNNSAFSNIEDENGHYLQINTNTTYNSITQKLPYDIVKDKTITISYDYQSSVSTRLDAFHSFQLSNTLTGGRTCYKDIQIAFDATDKWIRKSYTVDINDALFTSGTKSGSEQYFSAVFHCRTAGTETYPATTFKIRNFKLEIGNKATDWSAAPEDALAYIDETYSQVGGRNLLLNSNRETLNPEKYMVSYYDISDYGSPLVTGETYTITVNFTSSAERKGIACYVGGGNYQIGSWKAISAAGTYTYSWTFNATSQMHDATQRINVYCSTTGSSQGSTAIEGTCYVNWIKLEKGSRSSAWSLAPEDIALRDAAISTVDIYYAVNNSADNPPAYTDSSWSTEASSSIAKGSYLWSYVETTLANGEVIQSTPICLTSKPQILNGVTTQYAIYTSNTTPPPQSDSSWTSTRPNWTGQEGKYLWVRTEYSYSNPTEIQYSTPTFDASWSDMFNINKSIEDTNTNIMDYLQDGFVRVEKGAIYIMNQPSYGESTQAILLGQAGITFQSRPDEDASWTSKTAWGIDGTFDASLINVINLTANQIQNGILKLGNENSNGTFELYNTSKKIIVQANQNGLTVNLANGGTIKLDAANGFRVLDSNGNISYGRENNNNTETFFAKNEKVSESLIIGNVKIVPIGGNGIGFIAAS